MKRRTTTRRAAKPRSTKQPSTKQRGLRHRLRRVGNEGLGAGERIAAGVLLLGVILTYGTVGYTLLGLRPLDALYQTVITISTVGYGDPAEVNARYQIFTIGLILVGTGIALYTVGVVFEIALGGRLEQRVKEKRMQRNIDHLSGHTILCGFGQVGNAISDALLTGGEEVVVVDRARTDDTDEVHWVIGEATDDEVLLRAGLQRSRCLVVAMDSDADNVYVALSARALAPELFIVARANSPAATPKLQQAGADRVVNPHQIGGFRMAEEALAAPSTD